MLEILIWICVGVVLGVIAVFLFAAWVITSDWDGLDYTHEELDRMQEENDDRKI